MRFRPTVRQAVGRSLRGGLVAMTVAAIPMTITVWQDHGAWPQLWILPAAMLIGVVAVLPVTLSAGLDADSTGIRVRAWHPRSRHHVPWHRVTEIRAEHRDGRTVPVVYWGQDGVWRSAAPFDGSALGADPRFDEKLCLLRDMWKTHRHNRLHDDHPALL